MPTPSELALRDFQVKLSSKKQAEICPEVTSDVIKSVAVLEDLSSASIARKTGIHLRTMQNYFRGARNPSISKFVRIMNRLGYTVHLVHRGTK